MPACCYYNGACITPDARRHKANLGVHTTQWRGCTPNYIWNLPPYVWDYNGDIWIRSHLLSGMHIQEGTCLYIFCINRAVLPSSQGFSFQWGTRAPGPLRNFMSGIESTNFWLKPVEKKTPDMHSQSMKVHWNNKRHDKIMQVHYQVTKNSTWLWKTYHTPSFCPNKILWTSRSCGKYSMNHLGDVGDHFAISQL